MGQGGQQVRGLQFLVGGGFFGGLPLEVFVVE